MVGAGLNVIPTALLVLGFGAMAVALAPRAAARTVYVVVTASLIIDLLASMVDSAAWLGHLSLFHYMALAPAEDVDPTTIVVTVVLAAALCLAAIAGFSRRDVQTG
jgi:putative exporter of polyketide antibiotics